MQQLVEHSTNTITDTPTQCPPISDRITTPLIELERLERDIPIGPAILPTAVTSDLAREFPMCNTTPHAQPGQHLFGRRTQRL